MLQSLGRRLYLEAARKRSSHVTATVDGIDFLVSTRDDGPGRALAVHGSVPEFDVLARAQSFTGGCGVLVDVGANIGTTALSAVLRHGYDRVVAIEPEPANVRVLAANVVLNGAGGRVDVVAAAASDEPGTATFHAGKQTRNGWRAGAGSLLDRGDGGVSVKVTTVDFELEQRSIGPEEVGLLWIDAQGHESHVIHGAKSLVDRSVPIVFALRPRKLAKAGRLDELIELLQAHYTSVVDLRSPAAEPLPSSSLPRLVAETSTTDVLAF